MQSRGRIIDDELDCTYVYMYEVCMCVLLDLIGIVGGVLHSCESVINSIGSTVYCHNYSDHKRMKNVI